MRTRVIWMLCALVFGIFLVKFYWLARASTFTEWGGMPSAHAPDKIIVTFRNDDLSVYSNPSLEDSVLALFKKPVQPRTEAEVRKNPALWARQVAKALKSRNRAQHVPKKKRLATVRQTVGVNTGHLFVSFEGGLSRKWSLPAKHDTEAIRRMRDEAVAFATECGATLGQVNAVKKALTDQGYFVSK